MTTSMAGQLVQRQREHGANPDRSDPERQSKTIPCQRAGGRSRLYKVTGQESKLGHRARGFEEREPVERSIARFSAGG